MKFESKIDYESLKRLQRLIGHKFLFLGGTWEYFLNNSDHVLFVTDGPSLEIYSDDLVPTDDPDYLYLEFGYFNVKVADPKVAENALKNGHVSLQERAGYLQNVYVTRCSFKDDESVWKYDLLSDTGIVFELSTGCIHLSFFNPEFFLFNIKFFENISEIVFEDSAIERELISVDNLLSVK